MLRERERMKTSRKYVRERERMKMSRKYVKRKRENEDE